MGVVHHAAYLPYLEEARVEYLRAIGHPYLEVRAEGVDFAVLEVAVQYLAPLRFDDVVDVHVCWRRRRGRRSRSPTCSPSTVAVGHRRHRARLRHADGRPPACRVAARPRCRRPPVDIEHGFRSPRRGSPRQIAELRRRPHHAARRAAAPADRRDGGARPRRRPCRSARRRARSWSCSCGPSAPGGPSRSARSPGYSALCIARGLPDDGHLLCCDVNETWTAIGRRYWDEAGVGDKIELRIGPAIDTLRALPGERAVRPRLRRRRQVRLPGLHRRDRAAAARRRR